MPCPFFFPVKPLAATGWARPPRLPLGRFYSGTCQANPAEPFEPAEEIQTELCNCGYARGRCDKFPSRSGDTEPPDAIRFAAVGAEEDDGSIPLVFVYETGGVPGEHGTLRFDPRTATFQGRIPDARLAAQAKAFVAGYLRPANASGPNARSKTAS